MNVRALRQPAPPRWTPTNRLEALYVVAVALGKAGWGENEQREILRQIDHGHPALATLQAIGGGK